MRLSSKQQIQLKTSHRDLARIISKVIQAVSEVHLSNSRVQVVHDHEHDGGCLTCAARVLIDRVRSEENRGRLNSRQSEIVTFATSFNHRRIFLFTSGELLCGVYQK